MNSIICHNAINVTEDGITVESATKKIYINFDICAQNFSLEKGKEFSKCVATRDITTLSFVFYTQPKTNLIFKRKFFKDLISRKSAVNKFLDVQKAITEAGYTSYDIS